MEKTNLQNYCPFWRAHPRLFQDTRVLTAVRINQSHKILRKCYKYVANAVTFPKILFIVHTNLENCQWIPMLLSLILESNLIVLITRLNLVCWEKALLNVLSAFIFLKFGEPKKQLHWKSVILGFIYLFLLILVKNHLCPGSPKIWTWFLNSRHCSTENSFIQSQRPVSQKACLRSALTGSSATRWMFLCFSEYYYNFVLCTYVAPSIVTMISAPWSDPSHHVF